MKEECQPVVVDIVLQLTFTEAFTIVKHSEYACIKGKAYRHEDFIYYPAILQL